MRSLVLQEAKTIDSIDKYQGYLSILSMQRQRCEENAIMGLHGTFTLCTAHI